MSIQVEWTPLNFDFLPGEGAGEQAEMDPLTDGRASLH